MMQYRTEYVPHTMTVPAEWLFQPDGQKRQAVRSMPRDVLRIIAGATHCHVMIDIQRPYYRPVM